MAHVGKTERQDEHERLARLSARNFMTSYSTATIVLHKRNLLYSATIGFG
ncbi:hypothetical protein [Pontibacter pudoricolor]|nr:hypothetical protein [Pontibacter pudoricolor]